MSKKNKRITSGGARNSSGQTLIMTKPRIFALDIGDYVKAIDSANDLDYYNRTRLYDLYTSIMMDGHLKAVIGKRKASALSVPIVFMRDGKVDEQITELIKSPWFDDLLDNALDATYYGFTLLQLFQGRDGWLNAEMIPRKHVDPERRLILRQQHDTSGASWDEFPNMLFIGSSRDLGLLACAAPYALYKRNSLADWAQFSEVFGMPMREYTYDGNDPEARDKILNDIYDQGSLAIIIHPEGSNVKFVDSPNKSGSVEVYERIIVRCNNEMSKLILGNTLSTEAGDNGTQALATVQQEGEDYIRKQDRKRLLNILNYELTDYFARLGIDTKGGKFEYSAVVNLSVTEFVEIVTRLFNLGLPIDWDEVYERTGLRKPQNAFMPTPTRTKQAEDTESAKPQEEAQTSEESLKDEDEQDITALEEHSKGIATAIKETLMRFFGLAPRRQKRGADSDNW